MDLDAKKKKNHVVPSGLALSKEKALVLAHECQLSIDPDDRNFFFCPVEDPSDMRTRKHLARDASSIP